MTVMARGWCPGALRPMETGDGLIVRVRPPCGAVTSGQAHALADLAERFGNGQLELTRRANLQIRGVGERGLPDLQRALDREGLLDGDVEAEAARNVMVAPLAGIDAAESFDVRPLARALAAQAVRGLSPKFGMLVDGGGTVSIAGERADISLAAVGGRVALGVDTATGTRWLGATSREEAASAALALARSFARHGPRQRARDITDVDVPVTLDPLQQLPAESRHVVGALPGAVGIAAPFGQLTPPQLHGLADLSTAGAADIRLSPWRTLYMSASDPQAVLGQAEALGLIVRMDDPLLRVDACPGTPACRSSSVDSRADARRLAARGQPGTLHVSGCAKGCARSAAADLVLVGEAGRYGVVHNGTTRDRPEHWLTPDEL